MTTNQIAYWELQEKKRANRMQEQLKGDIQDAQKKRWMYQNANDTAKNVMEGISKLTGGGVSIGKLVSGLGG